MAAKRKPTPKRPARTRKARPKKQRGSIISSLNRAFDDASRRAIKDFLALVPGSIAFGKLLDQLNASPYLEHLRKLTLDEFAEAIRSVPARIVGARLPRAKAAAPTPKRRSYNTRTAKGRQRLDADVEGALRSLGNASATDLRDAVGGTPAQIRGALERLAKRRLVSRKGQRRATRYIWKS